MVLYLLYGALMAFGFLVFFVPRHGSALVPQKAAASPLCDAVPRLPDHAVHGHVQHVFQRLPVAGPLPDAGARPADGLDR